MVKKMLISVDADESRVAIVNKGRLENLELETLSNEQLKGNVYKGVVHKVEPSFQAAFVDFGADKQGFLPVSEIHPNLYPPGVGQDASITQILKPKQEVLVQVIRDEIGNKGATLSTHLSVPGRYLVLISESDKTGISRKISEEERMRLKDILGEMPLPKGFGVIVRTAGTECDSTDLLKDLRYLTKMWEVIDKQYKNQKDPGLLYEERALAIRSIRDYLTDDIEQVLIDDPDAYQEVMGYVSLIMEQHQDVVQAYTGSVPLFIKEGIEDQIEEVFSRKVPLPSGGSIVIDSTEALVAIDVNSGRVKGDGIEETAFKTNLEAAREVARQVIIRDLGGLVIIDFIDMKDRKRIREVENELREAFKYDKARRKFARISEFGLLEMSRQRLKSTLMKSSFERCNHCSGQGKLRTADSAGMYLLRRLREVTASGRMHQVIVRAPSSVANFMLNRKRRDLLTVEAKTGTLVEVYADSEMPTSQASLEFIERVTRGKPKHTVQRIDLVRSEIVRRENSNAKKGDVIFREAAKSPDFATVYEEVEEDAANAVKAGLFSGRRKKKPAPARSGRGRGRKRQLSLWERLLAFLGLGKKPEPKKSTSSRRGGRGRSQGGDRNRRGAQSGGKPRNQQSAGRRPPREEGASGDPSRRRRRRRGRRGRGGGGNAEGEKREANSQSGGTQRNQSRDGGSQGRGRGSGGGNRNRGRGRGGSGEKQGQRRNSGGERRPAAAEGAKTAEISALIYIYIY